MASHFDQARADQSFDIHLNPVHFFCSSMHWRGAMIRTSHSLWNSSMARMRSAGTSNRTSLRLRRSLGSPRSSAVWWMGQRFSPTIRSTVERGRLGPAMTPPQASLPALRRYIITAMPGEGRAFLIALLSEKKIKIKNKKKKKERRWSRFLSL